MSEEILVRAEEYLARRRNRMRMLRAFTAMALVVAIMTSYVLMLPGLTMEAETYCGHDEHAHTESCYTLELTCTKEECAPSETVVKVLECSFKPHAHTDACYAPDGSLGCGISTSYWHRHSGECYDDAGNLVCTLANNPKHVHSDACYSMMAIPSCTLAETPGHAHDSSCYTRLMDAEPTCGLIESDGHVHTPECTATTRTLVCDQPEATSTDLGGHVHTDACYRVETNVCTLVGGEGAHTHTESCYPMSQEPTCGLESGAGAHTHGTDCYTYERGSLTCSKLHDHTGDCCDPATGYIICGKTYVLEHNHSAYCLRSVTAVVEGHTHTSDCYTKVYTCGIDEHAHTSDCFVNPNPEVPAEPTVEPTIEPTAAPTAEPTAEPTATQVPIITPAPTAESTMEPTAEPTVEPTATPTAEPTAEPTATQVPIITPAPTAESTVEPTAEPTVEPTLVPPIEPTAEPTATPTKTPAPETDPESEYKCDKTAHQHNEGCYDENGTRVCGKSAHVHDSLCINPPTVYRCGLQAHTHTDACFVLDADGNAACTMMESDHVHNWDCYFVCGKREVTAEDLTSTSRSGLVAIPREELHTHTEECLTLAVEPKASDDRADFSPYVAKDKNNVADGVSIQSGATTTYNPETGNFSTTVQLNFAIPNYVLKGYGAGWVWSDSAYNWWTGTWGPGYVWDPGAAAQTKFYLDLPDEIKVSEDMLNTSYAIKSAGGTTEGTFQIKKNDDGTFYLEIDFSDTYLKTISAGTSRPGTPTANTPYSQGSLYFECEIDGSAVNDKGEIKLEFTNDDILTIPGDKIEYPTGTTYGADMSVSKDGSYVVEGNKLIYTVKVSSEKGTPGIIKLEDVLTVEDPVSVKENGITVTGVTKYTEAENGGGGWERVYGSESTVPVGEPKDGGYKRLEEKSKDKMKLELPKLDESAEGTRTTYEVTYEVELNDFTEMEFSTSVGNKIKATSGDPGKKIEVTDDASVSFSKTMLQKSGQYQQTTGLIDWTITMNPDKQNIAGKTLTDEMFSQVAENGFTITKSDGTEAEENTDYEFVTVDGKVTGIKFLAVGGTNTEKYTIKYSTTPVKTEGTAVDANGSYTVTNTAKVDDDITKTAGVTVTPSSSKPYKNGNGTQLDSATNTLTLNWNAGINVSTTGLTENLVVSDDVIDAVTGYNGVSVNHYMTLAQIQALYDSIKNQEWFKTGCPDGFLVKVPDQTDAVPIETVLADSSAYADTKFEGFTFTITPDLPASYNGKQINLSYSTTSDVADAVENAEQFTNSSITYTNEFGFGENPATGTQYYKPTAEPEDNVNKLNAGWNDDPSYTVNSKTGEITWHAQIDFAKDYDEITITDTLPAGLELVRVELGEWMQSTITPNGAGGMTVAYGWSDELYMTYGGTYTSSGNITESDSFSITVTDRTDVEARSSVFAKGKRMELRIICKLKPEAMPEPNADGVVTKEYTLTNDLSVDFKGSESKSDSNTQKLQVTSEKRVTKTFLGGTQNTGDLSWKVEVYQDKDDYTSLTITDTLPDEVELKSITLGSGSVLTYDGTALTLTTQAAGDAGLTITGTYVDNVVEVTVTKVAGATINSSVWGEGNKFPLVYNCKIKDELMPNPAKGEYDKVFAGMVNEADVDTNEGEYGVDSTESSWEVKLDRPEVEEGKKTHTWQSGLQTLTYTVDINPSAADLDPSANMIDVTDVVTYSHNDGSYNRVLTLVKDTVKLYYADYDEYGNPMKDADGRLIRGQEVPYDQWTMAYYEAFKDDGWSQSTSTMELKVPDGRALILVYDYFVQMDYVDGWDNLLYVSNDVTVHGVTTLESSDQTTNEEAFKENNAGGFISSEDAYTFTKVDSLNHALVLEGALFRVDQWVVDDANPDGYWKEGVVHYYTDALGMLTVMYNPESDENVCDYVVNQAYRITEIQAPYGYELPPTDTFYYFYWSDDSVKTSCTPDMFNGYATDLTGNATSALVENTKRATAVTVEKRWLDTDGNALAEDEIPGGITVHLRRYAIPAATWEANKDRYNGDLPNQTVNVTVALYDQSGNFNVAFTRSVVVGATLHFDVTVNDLYVGHTPQFSNLPAGYIMTTEVEGSSKVYHFQVPIPAPEDDNDTLTYTGKFQSNEWWGWTGSLTGTVRFDNISATFNGTFNDAPLQAELKPYIDRTYNSTMTLTSAGNWTGSWSNLDVVGLDENGQEVHYKYFVVEESPSGFKTTITGGSNDLNGSFTVVNTKDNSTTLTTSLRVIKEWYDENGIKTDPLEDAVEIRLYQKNNLTGEEHVFPYNGFSTTVINENTGWQFFFKNLPYQTTDAAGNVVESFSYRVEEITKGDFTTEIVVVDDQGIMTRAVAEASDAQVIIKNTKKHPVDITVVKAWSDGADKHTDDVVVVEISRRKLTPDGYVDDPSFSEADTMGLSLQQELHEGNGWTFTWLDLPDSGWEPKLDSLGNPVLDSDTGEAILESVSYQYVVKEISVNGEAVDETNYHVTYSTDKGAVPNDGSMTITNSTPARMDITKKWWTDEGGGTEATPPVDAVYVKLFKGDEDITSTLTQKDNGVTPFNGYIEVGKANDWKVSIIGLETGVYSIKEYLYDEATGTYVECKEEGDTLIDITHTGEDGDRDFVINNKAGSTKLLVKKTWVLLNPSEGVQDRLSATFTLWQVDSNGVKSQYQKDDQTYTFTLSKDNDWQIEIEDLPAQNTDGTLTYTYYVVEDKCMVDGGAEDISGGFTVVYSNSANGTDFVPVANNGTITVENRQKSMEVSVQKSWQDANGNVINAPNGVEIEIGLYRRVEGGEEELVGKTIVLPNNGSWTATIKNLPTHSNNGKAYSYYFKELSGGTNLDGKFTTHYVDAAGNVVEATTSNNAPAVNGHATIINKATATSIKVVKAWKDAAGEDLTDLALLPESVTIKVYQRVKGAEGGTEYCTFTLPYKEEGAESSWERTLTGLPATGIDQNGNIVEYEYTVKEVAVNGFDTTNPENWVQNAEETLEVSNKLTSISLKVKKVWVAATPKDAQKNVQLRLLRYILDDKGQMVFDGSYDEAIANITVNELSQDDAGAWVHTKTFENLPTRGTVNTTYTTDDAGNFVMTSENSGEYVTKELESPVTGEYHYFVVEVYDLGEKYEVTYQLEGQTYNSEYPTDVSTATDGATLVVTNRLRTKLVVTKSWDDVPTGEQEPIEFTLWRTESGDAVSLPVDEKTATATFIETGYLNKDNDWTYTFYDLPGSSADGTSYLYFVTENTEGWDVSYSNGKVEEGTESPITITPVASDGSITITNAKPEADTYEISVVKKWVSYNDKGEIVDDAPDGATVTLQLYWQYTDGTETPTENGANKHGEEVVLNAGSDTNDKTAAWEYTFKELPTEVGGYPVRYYVVETARTPSNFEVSYSNKTDSGFTPINSGEITITNSQPSISIGVEKVWSDLVLGPITAPADAEVTLQIWQLRREKTDNPGAFGSATAYGNTFTLNSGTGWSRTIPGLPSESAKTTEDTTVYEYAYAITEVSATGIDSGAWTVTSDTVTGQGENTTYTPIWTGSKDKTATITNSVPTTSVTINKAWFQHDGATTVDDTYLAVCTHTAEDGTNTTCIPASVDVDLYYRTKLLGTDGTATYSDKTFYKTYTVTKENGWTLTIENLPRVLTDANGNLCDVEYIVEEVVVADADSHYDPVNPTDFVAGNDTLTVKNVHEARLVVNKEWFNASGDQVMDTSGKPTVYFSLYRTASDVTTAAKTIQAMQKGSGVSRTLTSDSRDAVDGSRLTGVSRGTVELILYNAYSWVVNNGQYTHDEGGDICSNTVTIDASKPLKVVVTVEAMNENSTPNKGLIRIGYRTTDGTATYITPSVSTRSIPETPIAGEARTYIYSFQIDVPSGLDKVFCSIGDYYNEDDSFRIDAEEGTTPTVTVICKTEDGKELERSTVNVTSNNQTITAPTIEGYTVREPSTETITLTNGTATPREVTFTYDETASLETKATVTLNLVDMAGNALLADVLNGVTTSVTLPIGQTTITAPEISGYTAETKSVIITVDTNGNVTYEDGTAVTGNTITFKYQSNAEVAIPEPEVGTRVTYDGQTVFHLGEDNNWQWVFDDLPDTDPQGRPYQYFVVEQPVDGYDTTYDPAGSEHNGTLTIKNQKHPEPVNLYLKVSKVWEGDDADTSGQEAVTFKLYRKQVEIDAGEVITQPTVAVNVTGSYEGSRNLVQNGTYKMILSTYANSNSDGFPATAEATYNGKTYVLTRTTSGSLPVKYSMVFTATTDGELNALIPLTGRTDDVTWSATFSTTTEAETLMTATASMLTAQAKANVQVDTTGATEIGTYTLTEDGNWEMYFKNLPAKSPDGKYKYLYFVVEESVPTGYEVSYSENNATGSGSSGALTITNTKIKEIDLDLTVTKEWKAAEGETIPTTATATFQLWQISSTGEKIAYDAGDLTDDYGQFTLDNGSNKSITITGLPGANEDNTITYSYLVEEISTEPANAFRVSYSDTAPIAVTTENQTAEVTVTNTQKTTVISVEKLWKNADGSNLTPPKNVEVVVTLERRSGRTGTSWETYTPVGDITLKDGAWSVTLKNLPAVDVTKPDDNTYYYRIVEKEIRVDGEVMTVVDGFKVTTATTGASGGKLAITNTAQTISLTINKKWFVGTEAIDGDAAYLPDSINVMLQQAVVTTTGEPVWTQYGYEPYTVTKASNWTLTIANLPLYTTDADGNLVQYQYRVEEQKSDDYAVTYTGNAGTSTNGAQITIRNTLPTTSYMVTKVWGNGTPETATATIELYKTITIGEITCTELVDTVTLTPNNTTEHTWNDLPVYGDVTENEVTLSGKLTYFVREVDPVGYISTSTTEGNHTTITNTPTQLTVEKVWKDSYTGDTIYTDKTVYYKIMQQKGDDGTPEQYGGIQSLAPNATNTHYALPIYWTEGNSSGTYRYSVVEVEQVDDTWVEVAAHYSALNVNVATNQHIVITNTRANITVRKMWSVNGGALPATLPEVTLELRYTYTAGVTDKDKTNPFETVTLKDGLPGMLATKDSQGNVFWTYTWTDLPSYDLVGDEVKQRYYYVVEVSEPAGFTHAGNDMNNLGLKGNTTNVAVIQITNELITYELPETGGTGTTPYTVCGLLAIITAAMALMYIQLVPKKQWGEGRES